MKTRVLLLTAVLLVSACGASGNANDGPPPKGLIARDDAKWAGIADQTYTHGDDCVGDVNKDGYLDVLLNSHSDEWKLFFGSASGRFTRAPNRFALRDRHGCALADFNGDGMLDLYFSIGACKGTCRSAKELWIQRRDHTFFPAANKWGVVDAGSRGRAPIVVNANGDNRPDLFTTADISVKYPSSDKLWINAGNHFVLHHGPPTEDIGAFCAAAADIRHTGLDDIAVCKVTGFVLYRALGGGKYVEDTTSFGLTSFGRRAVRFADVNHDGWIDFISVTRKGVTVLLNKHGRFAKPVFELRAKNAIDAALGDVDGDGALDLYVQLGPTNPGPDKLFLGDGTGHFGPGPTLPRHRAAEESVTVLPHWRNGRDAFIVNNGYEGTRGVRQLIDVTGERRPST